MKLHGVIPVAPTPFDADGNVDLDGYAANIDRLINAGVHGVVSLATAGEGPSMDAAECLSVVRAAIAAAAGRVPVLVGFGGPNERDTLAKIDAYAGAGADGLLIVTPYFYPLTTSEMVSYFQRIGASSDLPFMFYNSTYANLPLTAPIVEELANTVPNFVALKEGNQTQASEVIHRLGDRIGVFSSRDLHMHELLAAGGAGLIAFTANIVPELVVELHDAAVAGNHARAKEIQAALNPLVRALVARSFPAAIKSAMRMTGWAAGPVRLPLTNLTEQEESALRVIVEQLTATVA